MTDDILDLMAEVAASVVDQIVPRAVEAAVARLPVAKDGRDGRDGVGAPGRDGRDGRDGADAYLPVARAYEPGTTYRPGEVVTRAGSSWQATASTNSEPGPNGLWTLLAEKGDAGKDARDPIDVAEVDVQDGSLFVLLSDGRSKNLGSIMGPQGLRGEKGARGEKGDPGRDGLDARAPIDVADALINESGELVIRLSDGAVKTAGKVVGRDGVDGKDGIDGKDARDPVDIVSATITSTGKLLLNFSNGTAKTVGKVLGEAGKDGAPGPTGSLLSAWRGPFNASVKYAAGDVVQYGGSAYIAAQTNPGIPPGNGWDLFVAKGDRGDRTGSGSIGRDPVVRFNSVAASPLLTGQPIYVNGSAQVGAAQGDDASTAEVVGMSIVNVTVGATCTWQNNGSVERADWTDIVGTVALTPGSIYYASPTTAGALTATAPITEGQFVVQVGRAITTRELLIDIAAPVAL